MFRGRSVTFVTFSLEADALMWRIVGGDKGGLLVRKGNSGNDKKRRKMAPKKMWNLQKQIIEDKDMWFDYMFYDVYIYIYIYMFLFFCVDSIYGSF